jgi:hypothetical protein
MRKPKERIPERLRKAVLARDGSACRYCGSTTGPFQIDHVYPESKGGPSVIENLVVACDVCNHKKSAKLGIWPMPLDHIETMRQLDREKENARMAAIDAEIAKIDKEEAEDWTGGPFPKEKIYLGAMGMLMVAISLSMGVYDALSITFLVVGLSIAVLCFGMIIGWKLKTHPGNKAQIQANHVRTMLERR